MLKYFDIRLPTSGGWLVPVRWAEYLMLLGLFVAACFALPPSGALAAIPLLLMALALVPGREAVVHSHATARYDTLTELQAEGYGLRSRWLALSDQPLSERNAMAQWEVRRDTLIWMSRSKEKLSPFPEIAGIFQARDGQADLMEDLESALQTLSRLRRLVSLSRSLKLPI